jgi:hypothetical protein
MKKRLLILPTLVLLLLTFTNTTAQESCTAILGCDPAIRGLPDEVLAAYPEPNVIQLPIDDSLIYDRLYRKVTQPTQVFDAPGGNLLADHGGGFSYVTVNSLAGDWTQIDTNAWVPSNVLSEDVLISRYAGVRLPGEPLPYPMGWIMRHLNASEVPGGDPSDFNPFLYRYTKVNLYTYVEVDGFRWYQIGPGQWVHQFNIAKITPVARPAEVETYKWVGIDLYEQTLIAYEGETPVYATLIASGLEKWPTNEGLFNVYLRYERTTMSGAYQQEDFYSLQEVPWTMYFDGDIALHGTYWHDGFGYRHSHGCVNMSITDANWVYEWSRDELDRSVPDDKDLSVYVYSTGQYNPS